MTVEDIKQDENNNPSDELMAKIDQYVNLEGSRAEVIQEIVEISKRDNVDPKQIRQIIEDKLRGRGLSNRTIQRYLPDELKDKTKQQASLMRKTIGNKRIEQEQSIPEPQPHKPIEHGLPKIQSWDNTKMIEQRQEGKLRSAFVGTGIVTDTDTEIQPQQDTDQPVYREPDRVAPVLGDKTKTLAQVLEDKNTGLEQSYHTMNVPDKSQIPNSEWIVHNEPSDYTVTTQLQIYNGTGNNVGQFTVDVVAKCYPSKKTVELQPIDKATIKKVVV